MAGGLASLPGFGWVPLKVYRPCPELAKAGISYVRRGFTSRASVLGQPGTGRCSVH